MLACCRNRLGIRLQGPRPQFARKDGGEGGSHPSNVHDHVYAIGTINFTGDHLLLKSRQMHIARRQLLRSCSCFSCPHSRPSLCALLSTAMQSWLDSEGTHGASRAPALLTLPRRGFQLAQQACGCTCRRHAGGADV